MPSIFEQLQAKLTAAGIAFDVSHHEPVFTSEEAARVRGATLASGAKALVCKADSEFVMIVLPADCKLDGKRVRKSAGVKNLRFASGEEVDQLTGLKPGSIPPFGSLFNLPTWCDQRLCEQMRINFNAGDHAISINMAFADYQRVESPRLGDFASDAT